jgi:putative ABC transport system permease protein
MRMILLCCASRIPSCQRFVVSGQSAALGLAHVLRALLYQTSTYDTLAFVAVPVVLCVVAGAAVLLPARAGMKVEPTVALRYE